MFQRSLPAAIAIVVLTIHLSGQSSTITPRSCHAMTYVPAVRGVVAFGGARACGVDVVADSTLWAWDGVQWRSLGQSGPSRREDALLAYDARRQVLVLHGGRASGIVYRDTWEWNGAQSLRRATGTEAGPGPIEHAAGAYDERRGRVVVFGGGSRDGRMFADTWEWDGVAWRRRDVAGPVSRVGHSMAWSQADGAVLLYGGFNATSSLTDLWKWDGAVWTRLDSAGPAATEGPALVSAEGGPLLVGSRPDAAPDAMLGVWAWRRGRWMELASGGGPRRRVGQGVAYDPARRRLVLFGGYFATRDRASIETWELDGTTWRLVVADTPAR
jgi:hypothetical protein